MKDDFWVNFFAWDRPPAAGFARRAHQEDKTMRQFRLMILATVAGLVLHSGSLEAQDADVDATEADPLAPFERLIGGQWHLEGSYQEFEWGIGRRSVKARAYTMTEGEPRLVSEGLWFWHPGQQRIKGVFTASEMPSVLFDYTTRFEGDRMVNDLRAYDAAGVETRYLETWHFTDRNHYDWRLFRKTAEGREPVMSGTYSKRQR
jgi:hypothetical protein